MSDFYPSSHHETDTPNDPFRRLEAILKANRQGLEALAALPDTPLTIEALSDISPMYVERAESVAQTALQWPDDESAVRSPDDSFVRSLYGDSPDQTFIQPIISSGDSSYYNNLFLLLGTKHSQPSEDRVKDLLKNSESIKILAYGTKPYVARAYALEPEFMKALQEATAMIGDMTQWNEALYEGFLDADFNPDKALLLRATRIAYVMLARLMRQDDQQIQAAMLRFPQSDDSEGINDPVIELRS